MNKLYIEKANKYLYHEQIHANRLKSLIIFPKSSFPVCQYYLFGLKEKDFYTAYDQLLHIFFCMYGDMEQNPEIFGLPLYSIDKFNADTPEGRKSKIYFFPMMLFVAAFVGQLSDERLYIDKNKFMKEIKKYKITNINKIMNILSQYGFDFCINETVIYMEVRKNPNILKVLTAVADKAEKMGEIKSNTKLLCLYYKLFEQCTSYCNEYDINDYCEVITDYAEVITYLNEELKKLDFIPSPNGFYRLNYINKCKKKYNDIISLTYTEDCDVYIRLKLKHINSYADKLGTLPLHIKKALKNHICRYCSITCSSNNIKFILDGERIEACCYNSFIFYHPSIDDIKYFIKLIIWEEKLYDGKGIYNGI